MNILFTMVNGKRHLTDQEKDQVDLQIGLIFKNCFERITLLEKLTGMYSLCFFKFIFVEKLALNPSSTILDFLTPNTPNSDLLQHRSSVIYLLSKKLIDASAVQKDLQEKRLSQSLKNHEKYITSILFK